MAHILTEDEIESYRTDGYLVVDNAVTSEQLAALRADFDAWTLESAQHEAPYGTTVDGRARFDLAPDHQASRPALRRVASPVDVSDVYLEVMRNNKALEVAVDLLGENIEFNNSKVNAKQPGTSTEVKYHQDFLFQPHTNEDLVAALVFLDDVTLENGPLEVVPGSHRGPMFEHWHDGVFTGTVSSSVEAEHRGRSVPIHGPAGTACLLHTRLLHGSAPNRSSLPRTLLILEYRAEDSKPLQVNHLPSQYEGEVVRGRATNRVRCSAYDMEFPEVPTGASFFAQQAKAAS